MDDQHHSPWLLCTDTYKWQIKQFITSHCCYACKCHEQVFNNRTNGSPYLNVLKGGMRPFAAGLSRLSRFRLTLGHQEAVRSYRMACNSKVILHRLHIWGRHQSGKEQSYEKKDGCCLLLLSVIREFFVVVVVIKEQLGRIRSNPKQTLLFFFDFTPY